MLADNGDADAFNVVDPTRKTARRPRPHRFMDSTDHVPRYTAVATALLPPVPGPDGRFEQGERLERRLPPGGQVRPRRRGWREAPLEQARRHDSRQRPQDQVR